VKKFKQSWGSPSMEAIGKIPNNSDHFEEWGNYRIIAFAK